MKELKPSQFNVFVKDYPQQGEHLLYQTLTGSLVCLDDNGLSVLQSPDAAMNSESLIQGLQKRGFLVPQASDEGRHYLQSLDDRREQKGGQLYVTLLTNLQTCPLACVYCYQKGAHHGGRLSGEVSDRTLAFIKQQCLKVEAEKLWISYYGSEPLSYPKAIFETATALKAFCEEHGLRFRFGMVTSGVLLTRELVERLTPLGFCHAQITIDGNRSTHNATRPFQNGKGTYDVIMQNLDAYAGQIRTDVLCVLNEERIEAAYELVDTLAEKGLAQRHVRVIFSPESPDYSSETVQATKKRFALDGDSLKQQERALLVEQVKLAIYAYKRGLLDDLLPRRTWCAMQRHDEKHLVIEPDGTLRTCPTMIGRDAEYAAGHIDTGVGGIDTALKQNYQRSEQCITCRYLPICADCRVDALQHKGDLAASDSREADFDAIVPLLMKGYYNVTRATKSALCG